MLKVSFAISTISKVSVLRNTLLAKCNLAKNLFFEGLNKSREESTGYYWDNKPSLIELCKQRLLLYRSLEANSRKQNCQRTFFCIQGFCIHKK